MHKAHSDSVTEIDDFLHMRLHKLSGAQSGAVEPSQRSMWLSAAGLEGRWAQPLMS